VVQPLYSLSIDDALFVVINVGVDYFLDVVIMPGQYFFNSGLMLKGIISFEVDPFAHASPNFIVFSIVKLFSDV
jgi:hypothetical protein